MKKTLKAKILVNFPDPTKPLPLNELIVYLEYLEARIKALEVAASITPPAQP